MKKFTYIVTTTTTILKMIKNTPTLLGAETNPLVPLSFLSYLTKTSHFYWLSLFWWLISQQGFSQHRLIPQLDFEQQSETGLHPTLGLLGINDPQTLVIAVSRSDYWSKGENLSCIVYWASGSVDTFRCFVPSTPGKKNRIKKKRVPRSKRPIYWSFLQNSSQQQGFTVDKDSLNIVKRRHPNGTVSTLTIPNGTQYRLEIIQGQQFTEYKTTAPEKYIEKKFPGWKARQDVLSLINKIRQLSEK